VELEWSGNSVGKGQAWLTPGDLALELRVNDTDVKSGNGSAWWEGSAVEIGLKDALNPGPATMVVAIPGGDKPRLLLNDAPFEGGSVKVCRDPAGYVLSLRLPLGAAGIAAGAPFLWEIVCHVSALGTAHGKTRVSWQGSSAPKVDQSRYILAIPA
jgi:hypothetical protein